MHYKINSKERTYLYIMAFISSCVYGVTLAGPQIFLSPLFILLCFILQAIGSIIFMGNLRGNGIKVSPFQFPDIYAILESHAKKLGLKKTPDMYLIQSNGILNAFAIKYLSRNYVILHSDILELAYQEGMDAVSFVIGHELGHIKRGHTSFFKSLALFPAKLIPFLASAYYRGCEYTCDNIGFYLCPEGAVKGMLVLGAGKKLYKKVNVKQLVLEARKLTVGVKISELFSSHPHLVKRVAQLYVLESEHLMPQSHAYMSPSIEIKQNNATL